MGDGRNRENNGWAFLHLNSLFYLFSCLSVVKYQCLLVRTLCCFLFRHLGWNSVMKVSIKSLV